MGILSKQRWSRSTNAEFGGHHAGTRQPQWVGQWQRRGLTYHWDGETGRGVTQWQFQCRPVAACGVSKLVPVTTRLQSKNFAVSEQTFPAGTIALAGTHETAKGKSMYTIAVIPTTP